MSVPASVFAGLTGRIIVRLVPSVVDDIAGWSITHPQNDLASLPDLALELQQSDLAHVFPPSFPLDTYPLVSLPVSEILQLEALAAAAPLPPLHSLTGYWVVDARSLSPPERILLAHEIRQQSAVGLVYFERDLEDPWMPGGTNPYRPNQGYLRKAPEGIDAEAAWAGGYDGGGTRFIDLEKYWNVNHDDLQRGGTPIAHAIYPVGATGAAPNPAQESHGTHVLGIIAAQDNDQGIVGIAPNLASVELVSRVLNLSQSVEHRLGHQRGNCQQPACSPDRGDDCSHGIPSRGHGGLFRRDSTRDRPWDNGSRGRQGMGQRISTHRAGIRPPIS